jgi:CHAT domain-containing protein
MKLTASIAVMIAAGCHDRTSCLEVAERVDLAATIARCTVEYEQTRDPRAAVAAVAAHATRARDRQRPRDDEHASTGALQRGGARADDDHDDDAVVAWASRVGEMPGTARIWRLAAQVHERRGEREAMLAARQRALELWERAGTHGEAAYEALVLHQAYWSKSQLLPALLAARRARALALASDDQEMRRDALGSLFSLLEEIGDQRGAAAVLDEARAVTAPDDVQGRYYLTFNEGQLQFHEQRFDLARLAYRQALAFPDSVRTTEGDRATRYNLVEIDLAQGALDLAALDLAAALSKLPAAPSLPLRSARAFYTSLLARAQHDPARAERAVRELLADAPPVNWVWQLELVLGGALEDQGRREDAIAAYQRAIAAVERMRRDLEIDVLQLHLRDRKRAPYEALFALEAAAGHRDAAMAIAELMWRRGFIESFATAAEPSGAADPAAERVRGVAAVMQQLGRSATVVDATAVRAPDNDLLAFIEARGALWRYSRTELEVRLERMAMPAADAGRLVAALRTHPDDLAVAAQLGALLIPKPAVATTREHRPLVVVADGVLSGLPFAALRVEGRWLAEQRVLAYQPGLAPVTPAGSEPQPPTTAVVMAASEQPGARLPASVTEATEVARALGVTPLLGAQANLAALRGARAVGLLHLAAHGGIAPAGAFIRLADGEVTVPDVIRWSLAPRVVVLASCASGARSGGSLWGAMGGGFLAAGSQAVVATLWSVEDAATAVMIREFYAAHGDRRPHAALAVAQRKAIAAGVPPRQWASFVALGAP